MSNSVEIKHIVIKIKDVVLELTLEEAHELRDKLDDLFDEDWYDNEEESSCEENPYKIKPPAPWPQPPANPWRPDQPVVVMYGCQPYGNWTTVTTYSSDDKAPEHTNKP